MSDSNDLDPLGAVSAQPTLDSEPASVSRERGANGQQREAFGYGGATGASVPAAPPAMA